MHKLMLEAIGGRVTEIRDGYARGELPMSELVMQPTKVFHAGAIVTLADEVASMAIYGEPHQGDTLKDKPFPYSIQISVNLLSNDREGPLVAEAHVVKRGRVTVVDTHVRGPGDKPVALMRSTHLMVDLKKSGPHKAQTVASR